ncbi:type II secretion system protein GspM [Mesorhizobium sp. CAU 1741]|uniref:type II secretion system protein GspM n=1 Tax=Mesorhizobium sp. CAU 1741 TaxID=3140366 RepID=UPI00325AC833
MNTTLNRLVGLLVFLALPALLLGLATLNVVDGMSFREQAAQQAAILERLNNGARSEAGSDTVDRNSIYVRGETPSLAEAVLRQLVVDAVAAAGGTLIETRNAALPQVDGSAAWVALSASFEIRNEGLGKLMRSLESDLPLLVVDGLSVSRNAQAGEEDDPLLQTELTVRGARRIEAR